MTANPAMTARKTGKARPRARAVRPRRRLRHFTDRLANVFIGVGGVGVIAAVLLIFIYLLYEVLPLFARAGVEAVAEYPLPGRSPAATLHLAMDERAEVGMRLSADGGFHFFRLADGSELSRLRLPLPPPLPTGPVAPAARVAGFALDTESGGRFAVGLDDGRVLVGRYNYDISYAPDSGARIITPRLEYPFGEAPYMLAEGVPQAPVSIRTDGQNLILAGPAAGGGVALLQAGRRSSLLSAFEPAAAPDFDISRARLAVPTGDLRRIFIDNDRRWLFLLFGGGRLRMYDLQAALAGAADPFLDEVLLLDDSARGSLSARGLRSARGSLRDEPTRIAFLLGGVSLLVADAAGGVTQWFVVNAGGRPALRPVRRFNPADAAIAGLSVEQRRKNFITADTDGRIAIYNTTAHRQAFAARLLDQAPAALAVSPRGDALLAETGDGRMALWRIDNLHPDVSWSALWSRVWYEGYTEPEFVWQSSSASDDFEPKYSLVPLSFGTLKAAFYAMLLAAPLAVCGAVFTGYFMAPAMRRKVKPLIELMEALPTVVLGFLAGLWLAPFVERNLLGVFSVLVVLPLSMLIASFLWLQLPRRIRGRFDGWEAALLLPVVLLFGYLPFAFSAPLEAVFFGGDMRFWISDELGISYDQRNALVVGFAMGFAVIPTIFSIAEDAVFTVPKHLSYGSLALGATPWQSLYRVVLPTASPGIFSALMIGMGRAVGETMIVLMATGNTPLMDINIFEGMRTLAANIAVEIPESEVDSSHYRILFLAALVLFLFTFVFNTVAEVVRQRLRRKYSTI